MHSGAGSVQQAGAAAAPSKWDGERAVAVALVVLVVAVAGSCHRLRCLRSVFLEAWMRGALIMLLVKA